MQKTRREFLRAAAATSCAAGLWPQNPGMAAPPLDRYPRAGDPVLKDLTNQALDAARAAGAQYADVRVTITRDSMTHQGSSSGGSYEREMAGIGVRAFKDGAWGFVASTEAWTAAEAAR